MRLLYFAYSAAFREHTQSEVSLNYINEQISRFNCMLEKYSELWSWDSYSKADSFSS